VDHAIAAGEALLAAKGQVQYGQWLGWVDDHFHGSRRTAQVYMRMARNADVAHLAGQSSIKQALEAIPEPDRVVVVDPPHTGDPEENHEEPDLAEQKRIGAIVAELILGLSADLAALRSAFLNPESTRFNDEEARRLLGGENP
jgi:hypothetical protein